MSYVSPESKAAHRDTVRGKIRSRAARVSAISTSTDVTSFRVIVHASMTEKN